MKPHNLTLTMIGAGLLWTGWYGFNVGSIVFTDAAEQVGWGSFSAQFQGETGVTFMNTTVATMAAMLGWLLVERILHGKATSLGAASGVVAGLVAITPSCGAVNTLGAIARRRDRRRRLRRRDRAEVQVRPGRLARRGRRAPHRRHHRGAAHRLLRHRQVAAGHGRPVRQRDERHLLRRRRHAAVAPVPGGAVHRRLVRRVHRRHRPGDQAHDRLADLAGRGGRRHRLRPAR